MKKHFKIGELAKKTGISVQTIRYYEVEGLIHTSYRTSRGYRYFNEESIKIIEFIKYYKSLGFSLKEISVLLTYEKDPDKYCEQAQKIFENKIKTLKVGINDLTHQKDILEEKLSACEYCSEKSDCKVLKERPETEKIKFCPKK